MARVITLSIRDEIAKKLEEVGGGDIRKGVKRAIEFFILFYEPAKEFIKKQIGDEQRKS